MPMECMLASQAHNSSAGFHWACEGKISQCCINMAVVRGLIEMKPPIYRCDSSFRSNVERTSVQIILSPRESSYPYHVDSCPLEYLVRYALL